MSLQGVESPTPEYGKKDRPKRKIIRIGEQQSTVPIKGEGHSILREKKRQEVLPLIMRADITEYTFKFLFVKPNFHRFATCFIGCSLGINRCKSQLYLILGRT